MMVAVATAVRVLMTRLRVPRPSGSWHHVSPSGHGRPGLRWRRGGPRSGDLCAHHAVLQPLGPHVAEAGPLEQAPGAVVEDGHLLAVGVMRIALHHPTAGLRDQVEGT